MINEGQIRASLARAALVLLAVGAAAGCKAYPTVVSVPLDCTVEDPYEFQIIDDFEMVGVMPQMWSAGDTTVAFTRFSVQPIENGGRCGSTGALFLEASGQNDWGSLFGFNSFGPPDASGYEGVSFWARAPGSTGKTFTLLLNDPNTAVPAPPAAPSDGNCVEYGDAGVGSTSRPPGSVDPATGMVVGGGTAGTADLPEECGNSYAVNVLVPIDWRFYMIPFAEFQQGPQPNRVPNARLMETGTVPGTGLITSELLSMIFRMPKEQTMGLWIDNLGFYRKRTPGTGGDGSADAGADAVGDAPADVM